MIDIHSLKNNLQTLSFGREIFSFDTLNSTNTFAKALAEEGKNEGTLIITENQFQGRGRLSREWISEEGKNLTFSAILRPKISPEQCGLLPFVFAVAIAKCFCEKSVLNVECKWPNDILLNGKKICGMLLESSLHNESTDYVIVGIGLNVNQEIFPNELQQKATSIFIETQQERNREELLAQILLQSEREYFSFCEGKANDILQRWKTYSTMFGKEISISQNRKMLNGIAIDVSPDGELLVHVNQKLLKFNSADVTIIR